MRARVGERQLWRRRHDPVEAIGNHPHLKNGVPNLTRLSSDTFPRPMLVHVRLCADDPLPKAGGINRWYDEEGQTQ
jgi:hypothetical protein